MGGPASLIDAQASRILEQAQALATWHYNHVIGGVVTDGGTTQASGANTAPNVDIDVSQVIDCVVKGEAIELAAGTDVDSDAGDVIVWGATSGKAAVGAVCISRGSDGDTDAYEIAFGSVADTADAEAPTDAEITTALGHSNWCRVATFLLTRTGDTTITVTAIDHTARPSVTAYDGSTLSTTNSDFTSGDVTRVYPITTDPPPSV